MGKKKNQRNNAKKTKEKAYRKLSTERSQLTLEQRRSLKEDIARSLTRLSTRAERILRKKIIPLGFVQNKVLLGYIPDFICEHRRLIIEVDGLIHTDPKVRENDQYREAVLEDAGYTVLRVTNDQVFKRLPWVVAVIKIALEGQYERAKQEIRKEESKAKKERTRSDTPQAKVSNKSRFGKVQVKPYKGPKVVKKDDHWIRMPEPRSMLSSVERIVVIPPPRPLP